MNKRPLAINAFDLGRASRRRQQPDALGQRGGALVGDPHGKLRRDRIEVGRGEGTCQVFVFADVECAILLIAKGDDVADNRAVAKVDAHRAADLDAEEFLRNKIVEGPVNSPGRHIDYDRCNKHQNSRG